MALTSQRVQEPNEPAPGGRLMLILALALVLRVGLFVWAVHNSPDLTSLHRPDTISYTQPAESLLATGRFASTEAPEIFRTPGYPLFLLPGIVLGHVELITVALQMTVSLAMVWMVHGVAMGLTANRTAALAAAFLMAVEPLSVVYSSFLLSETVFTFVLFLSVSMLLRYLQTESVLNLVASAVLLAAATFIRPVSYYLPAVLTVVLLLRAVARPGWRFKLAAHSATFALVSIMALGTWQVRNYVVAGYPEFSASSDFNLYYHQGAAILARQSGKPVDLVQQELGGLNGERFDQAHPELAGATQVEKLRFIKQEGRRIVRQHPAQFAKIQLRGMLTLAANPGATDVLLLLDRYPRQRTTRADGGGLLGTLTQMRQETPLLFYANGLLAAALGFVYFVSCLGVIATCRSMRWQFATLVLIVAYFLGASAGLNEARLRHPIMPILCLCGGAGIAAAAARRKRQPQSLVAPAEVSLARAA